jgi:hypothetical protein
MQCGHVAIGVTEEHDAYIFRVENLSEDFWQCKPPNVDKRPPDFTG